MKRAVLFAIVAVVAGLSAPVLAEGYGPNLKLKSQNQATAVSGSEAASVASPHQSITYNQPGTIHYSGGYEVKNVPGIALGGPASGPCNGFSAGLGVSGMGFGIVGNMSKVDEGCEERETARIAALMGRMDIANLVLEEMEVVKRAKKRREETQKAQQQKPRAEAPAPTRVTEAQPQLVQASTMITPTEQAQAICDTARRTGDTILASRLNCPK